MIWWFFSFGYTIFPLEGRLSWQMEKSNWWIYVAIVGGKFSTFLHVRKFSSLKCRRQDKLLLNNLECLNFLASTWASFLCFFACEWYSLAFVSLGSSTVKCMISILFVFVGFNCYYFLQVEMYVWSRRNVSIVITFS